MTLVELRIIENELNVIVDGFKRFELKPPTTLVEAIRIIEREIWFKTHNIVTGEYLNGMSEPIKGSQSQTRSDVKDEK